MITFILKNKTLILIAIIVILIASLSGVYYLLDRQKDISNRFEQNYELTKTVFHRYKDKNGDNAIQLQETQLTLSELKHTTDSTIIRLYNQAKILGAKNRELKQLISVGTVVHIDSVFIPITDTLIIREHDSITRISEYRSKWLTATIAVKPDELEILNYESRDEIIISLVTFKKKKFFVSRWFEKKKYTALIKSMNPNSMISYSKNVRVTKQRGR